VGIYHSHGDESYVIGDGTSSIRNRGGIDDVAGALIAAAERAGVKTYYADQGHAPHDSGAYRRSRRTATSLLRRGAGTLFDVHRDTAPRPSYSTEIQGRATAKVMLVVGRANPAKQATLSFVRTVKRTLDQTYPGLVRGIYFGRGGYNQDLSPRSVLLEIGSHRTPKAEAQQAATFIGLALPEILGAAGLPAGGAGRASWSNLGWIVFLVALGAGAYLVYASGGLRPALAKLRGFTRGEFGSMLAPRPGRSPRRSGRDGDRGSGEAGGGQR
jgi:stage II sporulation protein P